MNNTVTHLSHLVAADTQNPPRKITSNSHVFEYLSEQLAGFEIEVSDLGEGCVIFHAVRGNPSQVFNFHLDTVPASEQWTKNPFELHVDDDKAYGLGACDIKGALACMLTVAQQTTGDLSLLVTSDEEAGNSHCVRHFVAQPHDYQAVVVAEPTGCRAVTAHRGVISATLTFDGIPGHGSEARALNDNAIHKAMNWGHDALSYVASRQEESFENLQGIRMNVGTIQGGIKPNVIAPNAKMRLGVRTLPE
ncbi:MAG: M20/M25/M40 family metallo-hydrolase, partial [Pseudomonadota bacterium]